MRDDDSYSHSEHKCSHPQYSMALNNFQIMDLHVGAKRIAQFYVACEDNYRDA